MPSSQAELDGDLAKIMVGIEYPSKTCGGSTEDKRQGKASVASVRFENDGESKLKDMIAARMELRGLTALGFITNYNNRLIIHLQL